MQERGQPCLIPHVVPKGFSEGPNNRVDPSQKIELRSSKILGGMPRLVSNNRMASFGGVSKAWYKSNRRQQLLSGVVKTVSSNWAVAMPQDRPRMPPY